MNAGLLRNLIYCQQTLESDNARLQHELTELQQQLRLGRHSSDDRLRSVQQQLSAKIVELHTVNDALVGILQGTN
jgi:hypothetical protein